MRQKNDLQLLLFSLLCLVAGTLLYKLNATDSQKAALIIVNRDNTINSNNIVYYTDENRISSVNSSRNGSRYNKTKIFTILAWTESYYGRDWNMSGSKPFETCQYKNCYGTIDRQFYQSNDAILFHMRWISSDLPKSRPVNQKWIMHDQEPPPYLSQPKSDKFKNNGFNVTWTYNRKSDIWTNYSHAIRGGLFVKKKLPIQELVTKNYAAGKDKMAAWFASHCETASKREKYVKNLQKHMNVDIYGGCGNLKCDRTHNETECMKMLERKYKFYLAFENSICDDYVTEKLWKAIYLNIVPVVMGGFNYAELLPPKSYIDVKDYTSPKELADYLQIVNKNDTLYNEYLQWKGRYDIVKHAPRCCSVCEYLNKAEGVSKTYDQLDPFWSKEKDCHSPEKFYTNIEASSWY